MSQRDFLNRRRWAIDQKKKAFAVFVKEQERRDRERLDQLRALAASLEDYPHMQSTLDAVRLEIGRLESSAVAS